MRNGQELPCLYKKKTPFTGQTFEIISGVQCIRMPMPFALDHVNVFCIEDVGGWAVVDTGIMSEVTVDAWMNFINNAGSERYLSRVFVTHMHPDHVGMAGWITRKFGCRLWMSRLEYLSCRVLVSDTGREAPDDSVVFYRRAGWSDSSIETYRSRFGNFGKYIYSLPNSYRRLEDGEDIKIGLHFWRVVVGTGHSPEHVCLYCSDLKLLISGDQVLPKISSNVSVFPLEPDANPMKDWLDSLEKIKCSVPDDVLVLPSHNECFRGLHARLDQLAETQHQTFSKLRTALGQPKRVIDLFGVLFNRTVTASDSMQFGMATGETVACLNYLINSGEAVRDIDSNGVAWYRHIAV